MRYIAIFLLLANIAYFVWLRLGASPVVVSVPTPARALLNSGLTLVSEYELQLEQWPALTCFTVSSFISVDDASSFIAEIGGIASDASVTLSGDPLSPQYRVFLPPASSQGIATITLDSLSESIAAAQMEIETYLITRGLLENGIALGVFSEQASAQNTQSRVLQLGYPAEIEEITRSTGEIRVQLQVLEQEALENPAWLELTGDRTDLSIVENLCETIAQGRQFP